MNKLFFRLILELMAMATVFAFTTGCKTKTPETTPYTESATYTYIANEIYNDCVANNDYQGALDVLETKTYLSAFCCDIVSYDDVKNRNYNNIQYDIGELQIAVAAYNEYNDESAMDVEVDWICQYNSCTQEQHDAIEAYVEWYHTAQNGRKERTIEFYREDVFAPKYSEICQKYGFTKPSVVNLSPAQFREVQNYMADPNYQVDASLWE